MRRELAEYQDRVRNDPQCDLPPAVFNATFLFVQLAPTLPIQLHCVSHNACITDARSGTDIKVTTTEYEHTPQPGVQGFFGTFTPKANPDYDPRDRRKGPMFLRHQDVDRSQIKVYDVQTIKFKRGNKVMLRVNLCSLRVLTTVSEFTLPAVLPNSHWNDNDSSDDDADAQPSRAAPPRAAAQASAAPAAAPASAAPAAAAPRAAARAAARASAAPAAAPQNAEPASAPPAAAPTTSPSSTDDDGEYSELSEVEESPYVSEHEGEEDVEESQASALGSDEILDSDERATRPSAEPPLTASNAAGRDVLLPAHFWAEHQRPGLAGWQARIVSKQRKGRLYNVRLLLERTTCRFRLETLKTCKMLS